jgi:hypothetical protein
MSSAPRHESAPEIVVRYFWRLMQWVPEVKLRREYRRRIGRLLRARRDPTVFPVYLLKCALHYHQHTMAKQMALGDSPIYNSF